MLKGSGFRIVRHLIVCAWYRAMEGDAFLVKFHIKASSGFYTGSVGFPRGDKGFV